MITNLFDQAKAILELRLQKLTALEREDLFTSLKNLIEDINGYLKILNSNKELLKIKFGFFNGKQLYFSDFSLSITL